jgi:hypothetical protein
MVDELSLFEGEFLLVRFAKRVLDVIMITLMDEGRGKSVLCPIYAKASDQIHMHCC